MKNLLRTLFGGTAAPSSFKRTEAPSTLQTDSEAVNRQQLVMITVRDIMRISGIPSDWVDCQLLNVSSRRRGSGLYIHMVINHWDDRLLQCTVAFQTDLMARMERFDPKSAVWVHGVAWRLDVGDSCPVTTLPDKSFWDATRAGLASVNTTTIAPAAAQVQPAPTLAMVSASAAVEAEATPQSAGTFDFEATQPFTTPKSLEQDLKKLFAIRDEEIKLAKTRAPTPAGGFAQTVPAPLDP